MQAFLDKLRRQVRDERAAAWREVNEVWSKPIHERVADGYAIEGVEVVGDGRAGRIALRCARNRSRFREGDVLCLNRQGPEERPSYNVRLEEDSGTELAITLYDGAFPASELAKEPEGWVLDQGYIDLADHILEAIAELGDTTIGRERVLPILMGRRQPQTDTARFERGLEYGEAAGLNPEQSEALALGFSTDSVFLIQGPPGTGKTRVLAHLAALLVEEGERVLLTAFTHRALNNALNTLEAIAPLTPAVKIGDPSRADDLRVENYASFSSSPVAQMDRGYVVGATPYATRTQRLRGVEFDTVIVDEASQITVPLATMAMLAGSRYVFFGDHKQLPPVLISRPPDRAAESSIFGLLAERGFDVMLEGTYRLSTELADWPSRRFYQGRLKPVGQAASRRLELSRLTGRYAEALRPDRPKVFIDLGHRNSTTRSTIEAGAVADLIVALLEGGVAPAEIGVITPYRAQAREIRTLVQGAGRAHTAAREIVIDTVDRMQGQERDVIVLSLTTSSPAFALRLADFYVQPERLNVAVTRARKKLIVVGSSHLFGVRPEDPALEHGLELLEDLVQSCDYYSATP